MTIDFLDYNSCVWRPICTGGVVIERVKSFKLLGVYISEDLTWGVHCDYIIKKANRRLYALRTLKKCGVPTSDLITVYCSLIRSAIEYASAVFANLPKYPSDALEGVQKRTLRIILPNLHPVKDSGFLGCPVKPAPSFLRQQCRRVATWPSSHSLFYAVPWSLGPVSVTLAWVSGVSGE